MRDFKISFVTETDGERETVSAVGAYAVKSDGAFLKFSVCGVKYLVKATKNETRVKASGDVDYALVFMPDKKTFTKICASGFSMRGEVETTDYSVGFAENFLNINIGYRLTVEGEKSFRRIHLKLP